MNSLVLFLFSLARLFLDPRLLLRAVGLSNGPRFSPPRFHPSSLLLRSFYSSFYGLIYRLHSTVYTVQYRVQYRVQIQAWLKLLDDAFGLCRTFLFRFLSSNQLELPLSLFIPSFEEPEEATRTPPGHHQRPPVDYSMSFQDENPFTPAHDDSNVLPTSHPPAPPALPGTATPSGHPTASQQRLQRPHFHSFQLPMRKTVNSGKVAIPRQPVNSATRQSRRVPRACESCRQRKTKCSGDTPICRQCKELRISCQYPVSWRERTNRYSPFPRSRESGYR